MQVLKTIDSSSNRSRLLLCFLLLLASGITHAQAPSSPQYIAEMPSLERVMAEIQGADPMDTAARQMGAFWQLQQIIAELSGGRNFRNRLTVDEGRVIGQYRLGYVTAQKPFEHIPNTPDHPDRSKWYDLHSLYENDRTFRLELVNRFFSPALRDHYLRIWAQSDARSLARAREDAAERARIQGQQQTSAAPPRSTPTDADASKAAAALAQSLAALLEPLIAAEKRNHPFVPAMTNGEASELWRQILQRATVFSGHDQFSLVFRTLSQQVSLICGGSLTTNPLSYTVESSNGHVQLTVATSPPWSFALRRDGSLESLGIGSFGFATGRRCAVNVLQPESKPERAAGTAKSPDAAPGTDAFIAEGKRYFEAKDYQNAIQAYKKAIAVRPSSEAYHHLGRAYDGARQYADAVGALKESIRLKPDYAESYVLLGGVFFAVRIYPDAVAAFEKSLQLNMHSSYRSLALSMLGLTYLKLDRPADARRVSAQLATISKSASAELDAEIKAYNAAPGKKSN